MAGVHSLMHSTVACAHTKEHHILAAHIFAQPNARKVQTIRAPTCMRLTLSSPRSRMKHRRRSLTVSLAL